MENSAVIAGKGELGPLFYTAEQVIRRRREPKAAPAC